MSELTHFQWFEDTIKNLENIDIINNDYPLNQLVKAMRYAMKLFKDHDGDFAKISLELNMIPEEDIKGLQNELGLSYAHLAVMIFQAKQLFDAGKLNYGTTRSIKPVGVDVHSPKVMQFINLMYLAGTVAYDGTKKEKLNEATRSKLSEHYENVNVHNLSKEAKDKYQALFNSQGFNALLKPTKKCGLNLNDVQSIKGRAGGWFAAPFNSLTLQMPDVYIMIHETFHLVDHDIALTHESFFSDDERIAFFHELYDILASDSNNNVLNPFDYMTFDEHQKMVYKDKGIYDSFNAQKEGLEKEVSPKMSQSRHWMQSWVAKDIKQVGQEYFTTPIELVARLYTTAFSLAYPELDEFGEKSDNFIERVTLGALRIPNTPELQSKLQNWIVRFNDYANATLHNTPRQYASKKMEQLSADYNDDALSIMRDIQQNLLDHSSLKSTSHNQASNVFSIVHYKNAKLNTAFEEHIKQNLETYYKSNSFSPERKSHHLLQAFVDYQDGKIKAEDILLKVGFKSVSLDDVLAKKICTKYKSIIQKYNIDMLLEDDIFEYKEAAIHV